MKNVAKAGQFPQFTQFDNFNQVIGELSNTNKAEADKNKKKKLVKKYRKK